MILRAITLVAGLAGAFGAAQFPEFSQQYMQRLGGAVDALAEVVADFDASAHAEGLTRSEALAEMRGTGFVERRRADMTEAFAHHAQLSADLAALHGQGPFMRAYRAAHLTDPEIARRTWQAFEPAIPLSLAAGLFALVGFGAGSLAASMVLAVIWRPLRRGREPA